MHRFLTGAALAFALSFATTASAGERPLPPAPQRVIVKFEGSAPGRSVVAEEVLAAHASAHGVRFEKHLTLGTGAVSYWIRNSRSEEHIARVIAALARSKKVVYAERSQHWRTLFSPNDTRFNEQWHYRESMGGINLPLAWDYSKGDGVVVAVVDTGIVPHADLSANVLPGYDMIVDTAVSRDGNGRDSNPRDEGTWLNLEDIEGGPVACPPWIICDKPPGQYSLALEASSWHGTHVAGTIAALTNNSKGVAGVAPGVRIVPVRVIGKGRTGDLEDIVDGVLWAAGAAVWHGPSVPLNQNPAQVINLSIGKPDELTCPLTFSDAIAVARNRGASVVVSAGNLENGASANEHAPANCPDAITVAALDRQGSPASYASLGSVVDLAAPGGEMEFESDPDGVLSTLNTGEEGPVASPAGDTYDFLQGSSMAAPHVAGVLALIRSVNPTFTVAQAEQRLLDTARTIACPDCNNKMVDAGAAVSSGTPLPTVTLALSGSPMLETGGSVTVTANLSATYARDVNVKLAFSGTAQAGDFSIPSSITILAGQPSGSTILSAAHDATVEGNETIVVDIDSASFANESTPGQVTATIADDDSVLSFAFTAFDKSENNGGQYAPITVNRTGGLANLVTVNFSRNGGTATPNGDFSSGSVTGTLTFQPNQATASFNITVLNDSYPEPDETINLVLSNPTGGATIGSPGSTVFTINCNDNYNCQ